MNPVDIFWRIVPIYFRAFFSVPIFSRYVPKRKRFPLRYALAMVVGMAGSWVIRAYLPVWASTPLSFFGMVLVYGLVNAATAFCYDTSVWTIALIAASGWAVQDLAGHIESLLLLMLGLSHQTMAWVLNVLISMVILIALNFAIGVLLSDDLGHGENYLDNRMKGFLSFFVMLICIGMGRLTNNNPDRNVLSQITANVYAILVSIMLLLLQYSSMMRAKGQHEADLMREMVRMQHIQFESNKTNVQMVNEKYHDIHKLLNVLNKHVPQEQVDELRSKISGYDAQTHTGNEVLDVILTEKRLLCSSKNIQFTSMVDGMALDFVEELDLYALFSNLLSNSMEAVEKLPEGVDRFITLTVRRNDDIVSIHSENPCTGVLNFEDGLPVTSGDPEWHGFGMKSMERVAEKYGGTLSAVQDGNLFRVDILLFPPEKA